ncbi:hypothetical protein [Aliiglaciecola aliphaticivorans]
MGFFTAMIAAGLKPPPTGLTFHGFFRGAKAPAYKISPWIYNPPVAWSLGHGIFHGNDCRGAKVAAYLFVAWSLGLKREIRV